MNSFDVLYVDLTDCSETRLGSDIACRRIISAGVSAVTTQVDWWPEEAACLGSDNNLHLLHLVCGEYMYSSMPKAHFQ